MARGLTGKILIYALLIYAISALGVFPVSAAGGMTVNVTLVDTETFPRVTAYATVLNQAGLFVNGLGSNDFQVLENSTALDSLQVNAAKNQRLAVSVLLVVERGESSRGDLLRNAQASANLLVASLAPQDRVVLYAVGEDLPLEDSVGDRSRIINTIQALVAGGKTRVYDGMLAAIVKAPTLPPGPKMVIALTNGTDVGSAASADQVIQAAQKANVPVYFIPTSGDAQMSVPDQIAKATGGKITQAATGEAMSEELRALFDSFRQQYVITFISNQPANNSVHYFVLRAQTQGAVGETTASFVGKPMPLVVTSPCLDANATVGGLVPLCAESNTIGRTAEVDYFLDGKNLGASTSKPFSYTWESTGSLGKHILTLQVLDHVGNKGRLDVPVNVVLPVTVEITSPARDAEFGGQLTPAIKINTLLPVQRVEYVFDKSIVATSEGNQPPPTIDLLRAQIVPGPHTFTVKVFDEQNRQGEASVPVRVAVSTSSTEGSGGSWIVVLVILMTFFFVLILTAANRRRRHRRHV